MKKVFSKVSYLLQLLSVGLLVSCGQNQVDPTPFFIASSEDSAITQALSQEEYPSFETFEPILQKILFGKIAEIKSSKESGEKVTRIPIFVMTCDRLTVLIKALTSYYTRLDTPVEIVIHDNHSTYPPTIAFINKLEEAGMTVFRNNTDVTDWRMLNNVTESIASWYQTNDSDYYIVTDPDIELEEGSGSMLEAYKALLIQVPQIPVVGPMLRRTDIPDHYPMKAYVHEHQADLFKGKPIYYHPWNGTYFFVQEGMIDTVFGMYRKSFKFHNYNHSLQTYDPYQARHLDWYIDPNNLAPDQIYYLKKNSPVGHWSSTFLNK